MRSLAIAAIVTLTFSGAAAAAAADRKYDILMTGVWHGDEVRAKNGETWLALIEDDAGASLEPVEIRVELVHDGIVDLPGETSGKRVSCVCPGESTILVRGDFATGPLEEARVGELLRAMESDGGKISLSLSRDTLFVETRRVTDVAHDDGLYDLVVRAGNVEQRIARSESRETAPLWSGDLDGDGRVDFIFDTSEHYNVFAPTLFLSSEASKGEVAKSVATFATSGC